MIDLSTVTAIAKHLETARTAAREAMAAAAVDKTVPMQRVKELTQFHDQIEQLSRQTVEWSRQVHEHQTKQQQLDAQARAAQATAATNASPLPAAP